MNEESNVSDLQDQEQTVSPNSTAEVNDKEKVQTSESKTDQSEAVSTIETTVLLEHFEHIETQLDNLTSVFIVALVGIGIVVGAIYSHIFARYIIS